MKKDKNKKENLPSESMQDRFLRAFRQQLRDKEVTKIVVNGIVIRMPLGIILSRMKPTKLQMNIITTIMKVIGKNVANELQKESLGSLFSRAEFGEDENTINFVIREREFGIPRKHRKDLDDAVKMMTVFPIEIPVIGKVTGEKYTEHNTLCVIRVKRDNPDDDASYIVTMKRNVADLLINRDTEFASLTDISYKEFRSKFSYRFYLFTVSIYSAGKIAFSFEYIRKIFSDKVEEHKRYVKFEEDVLSKAQKDLLDIYNKGLLHYWFEYHPTAAERKALKQRGNPEEVIFEFHTQPSLPKKEVKVVPRKTIKEIEDKLIKEFGIFPNSAKEFVMQLTVDNISAFDEKVKSIREKMKAAEKTPNGFAFAAFKNFFKEYGNGFTEAKEVKEEDVVETISSSTSSEYTEYEEIFDGVDAAINGHSAKAESPSNSGSSIDRTGKGDKYWRNQFYQCKTLMERFGYELAKHASRLMSYKSYDEKNNILHIEIPGPTTEVQELIERNINKMVMWHITKYFPSDVTIEYEIVKFVKRSDEDQIRQLRCALEQQKLYSDDIMSIHSPLFSPKDEKGMSIPKEVWGWNYALKMISMRVSEQEFNDIFAKLALMKYASTPEPPCNYITRLLIQVPSREIYELLESEKYVALLQGALRRIFKDFELKYYIPKAES